MKTKKGVVDARIHVLRNLELNGQLDPALALILDEAEPGWRADKSAERWAETAEAVRAHFSETRETPGTSSGGAAGLRAWLDSQDLDQLDAEQRTELETLPGWRSTLDDPALTAAWSLVAALVEQGIRPRKDTQREAAVWLASEFLSAHPEHTNQHVPITGRAATTLLDYTLFLARNSRQPGRGDDGSMWDMSRANKNASPELRRTLNSLNSAPSTSAVPARWMSSLRRVNRWVSVNGRPPMRSGASKDERYCAGWIQRQTKRQTQGALTTTCADRLAGIHTLKAHQ
jgi:hypothetical protein